MKTECELYRHALKQSLTSVFDTKTDGIHKGLAQFDRAVNLGRHPSFAFEIVNNCFASEDNTGAKIRTIKEFIQRHLSQVIPHAKIDSNPISRMREAILRTNKNIKKYGTGFSIKGISLTENELEDCMLKMPEFLKGQLVSYTATANEKNSGGLELEVTYNR